MTQTKPTITASLTGKWKPYPAYKDSGVEWLGEIPAHWEVKRLKFAAAFFGGGTPYKENLDYWTGNIPWVSPKDMKSEIIYDAEDHITEEAIENSSTRLVQPGAVLIVVRSGILRHSIPVAINIRPVAMNQDMKALMSRPFLKPEYLASVIRGYQKALLVEWRKEGATVESIEYELLANTSCSIPPLSEQQAIITFLDRETARISTLIAKKERLIELLQEKRAALISHAVTKGLDPTVPMKDSGIEWLGEIPAHWEVKRVRDITELLQTGPFGSQLHSSDYSPYGIPVINPSHLKDGYIYPDWDCAVNEETLSRLLRHELRKGDIVFARRGEMGRCALVTEKEAGWLCGTGSLLMRPRVTLAAPAFLNKVLSTEGVKDWLLLESVGSTMDNLNSNILSRIPLPIPPLSEQYTIVNYLEGETAKIDALISRIREGIEKLKEYSAALISAAVTGKIDVREIIGDHSEDL